LEDIRFLEALMALMMISSRWLMWIDLFMAFVVHVQYIKMFVMNYAYMGRLNNYWCGSSKHIYVFMEVTLLFEVRLMMFLGVWDVLLVSMFPICVYKRINVGCCDFVSSRMGCCKYDFKIVCLGCHIRRSW